MDAPKRLPSEQDVGYLLEVHQTPWSSSTGPMILACIFLAISSIGWTWSFFSPDDFAKHARACFLLPFFSLATLVLLLMGLRNLVRPQTVLVFSEGLMRLRYGHRHFFRWAEVTLFESPAGGFHLRNNEGRNLSFDVLSEHAAQQLTQRTRQEIWQRVLPRAAAVYDADGTAEFGKFGVSKAGLTFKRKFLAWDDIFRLTIDIQGKFTVSKRNALIVWASVPVAHIPNFQVFEALVERDQPIYRLSMT